MRRTPCEYIMWNGLPVIRKEIAESMINNFGLNQKEAAEKLGVTPAAVCQYISKKRGKIMGCRGVFSTFCNLCDDD